MYRLRSTTLKALKIWLLPLGGILVLVGLLIVPWKTQQDNLNSLDQELKELQHDLKKLPTTVTAKDKLALEKDLLLIDKDRVNAQNAIYGTLIQTLGGIFFFVTAYLSWRNVKATEEKQVTERFSKAVEQLGSDKLEVRLGGIYALERIAKDSEKDHWTIMEVLTSFVLAHSSINLMTDSQKQSNPITTDIQAALTVIGRRDSSQDQKGKKIDLSIANLATANLKGANFRGANLKGVNFSGADLEQADLRDVYLSEANLTRANLNGAKLDKINQTSSLPVKKVDFTQASLIKAKLNGARLTRANLSQADLNEANLKSAYLGEANLNEAQLVGADLSEADLRGANLSNANLSGAKFFNTKLHGTDFSKAKGLISEQIKNARDWKNAKYDDKFRKALGLPSKPEGEVNDRNKGNDSIN